MQCLSHVLFLCYKSDSSVGESQAVQVIPEMNMGSPPSPWVHRPVPMAAATPQLMAIPPPPHSKAPDAQRHDTAASAGMFLPFSHLAFIFRSLIRSPVSPGQQPAALHPAVQGWVCRADAHSHFQLTATVNGTWHRVGLCVLSTSVWFSYYSCAL